MVPFGAQTTNRTEPAQAPARRIAFATYSLLPAKLSDGIGERLVRPGVGESVFEGVSIARVGLEVDSAIGIDDRVAVSVHDTLVRPDNTGQEAWIR